MAGLKPKRPLYLSDVELGDPGSVSIIPVMNTWAWTVDGAGSGYLLAPDGEKHCQFDLLSATIALVPGGAQISAPGLTLPLVQEMGEKYAYDIAFSPDERKAYDDFDKARVAERKAYSRTVYDSIKGTVQLERRNGSWLAHVDTERVLGLSGIESAHVVSREQGITLFNQIAEQFHAYPLRDPVGYMALDNNMYEFVHREYRNQYEDTLQAIDNNFIDATGYGVEAVLSHLDSTIRKNMSQNCMPDGERYGNLRFVPATDECRKAVKDFVKQRVDKTLTYEKKRSYEKDTIARADKKYEQAAERVKALLSASMAAPVKAAPGMEA